MIVAVLGPGIRACGTNFMALTNRYVPFGKAPMLHYRPNLFSSKLFFDCQVNVIVLDVDSRFVNATVSVFAQSSSPNDCPGSCVTAGATRWSNATWFASSGTMYYILVQDEYPGSFNITIESLASRPTRTDYVPADSPQQDHMQKCMMHTNKTRGI